jgi:hypothetical protein
MAQIMDCIEAEGGVEYELTEFLLMATQDELNAANAIQAELDNQKRFMTMFDDSRSNSPDVKADEDVAEDMIDVALSASSFVASWINKPVNGCQSGEYGRAVTPNENDKDAVEHAKIEQQLQGIEGVVSWRDAITDQILVGLGLRQGGQTEEKPDDAAAVIGLNMPLTDSSKSASDASEEAGQFDNADGTPEPQSQKAGHPVTNAEAEAKEEQNPAADARDESHPSRASIDGSERSVGSRNTVVIELVQKCLQTNGQPKMAKAVPSPRAAQHVQTKDSFKESAQAASQSVDARDDSSVHRDIPAVVDRNAGSKSDVIKKLAAKCLAMNNLQQMERMQVEPASYYISSPMPMGPPRPETPLFTGAQHLHNYLSADPDIRDPPIGPDICRDPPELKQPTSEMQQIFRPRAMHVKWSTNSTAMSMKKPLYVETQGLRQEGNSLTSSYYAQPPRPETPFHDGQDTSRCMKMFTRRTPSSFHQVIVDQRADELKSTPLKESVLSPSATLRRRHYKEMLLRERAAKNAVVE